MFYDMLLHSNTGQMVPVEIDLLKFSGTFGDKTIEASSIHELQEKYAELMTPLVGEDSPWLDEQNRPVRLANLVKLRGDTPEPAAETHPAVVAARKALSKVWEDYVADGLEYSISIKRVEQDHKLGSSKWGGSPDLPTDFEWPEGLHFVFQINFSEIHELDLQDQLPASGMLYYFVTDNSSDNVVFFSESDKLVTTTAPSSSDFLQQELKPAALIFSPIVTCSHAEQTELPPKILKKLRKDLHSDVSFSDAGDRFFGRPDGEWEMEVFNHYKGDKSLSLVLQVGFLDGYLYLGMSDADLKTGDFSEAVTAYWGT